jgi:hypothetical protein
MNAKSCCCNYHHVGMVHFHKSKQLLYRNLWARATTERCSPDSQTARSPRNLENDRQTLGKKLRFQDSPGM